MSPFRRSAIRDLYGCNRDVDIDKFPGLVTAHFRQEYASSDIPVLGLENSPDAFEDGSLVAFDAMIQDTTFSPEFYLAKTAQGDCGGWGLNLDPGLDHVQYTNLRECKVFWAVSIPGLTSWCTSSRESISNYCAPLPHKYPTPGTPHIGVQLKVYDEALSGPLRAADISTFFGVFSSEPLHANADLSEPRIVPTLHVLFTKPLMMSIVPRNFPTLSIVPTIKQLRSELLQWIADEALGGDLIAAEWILLTALAKVQSRKPSIVSLSLTLSGFPPPPEGLDSMPALHHVLSLLFPLVTMLPLSLDVLNNTSARPESKDEDLHSGWLQLPRGTILMLTESSVSEGSIFDRGVMNLRAAQATMRNQSLEYIFPFSSYTFETDINFIVLANGKKSTFFETSLNIPLRLGECGIKAGERNVYKSPAEINLPPSEKFLQFRQLVGGARVGHVNIGQATGNHVEEDFVKERAAASGSPSFTADDLVQRMLLSRTMALSFHEPEVTINMWESAKDLERRTKARQ